MFILASIISRKKAKGRYASSEVLFITDVVFLIEALAASSVKIAGRDVLATWKVLIALGVTPVLYTIYAIIATVIAYRANAPLKWRLSTPFIVASILPFANLAALKFGEAGVDVVKYAATHPTLSAHVSLTSSCTDPCLP
jgi:glycerol-3-phosphate O-acyltransferase/dihydroxyacetone phosphate acyltransferase